MDKDLTIELKTLSNAPGNYSWEVHKEFFESFENEEILAGNIHVDAVARKDQEAVLIDLTLSGELTVPCDRCGEPVEMHCGGDYKFVALSQSSLFEKDGREVLPLEEGSHEIDLSQVVYDYSLLSLPMQRFHEDGACARVVQDFLRGQEDGQRNNPFAVLKDIVTIK